MENTNNKELELLMAEHQLTGFVMGAEGTLKELISAMDLKKDEWLRLKEAGRVAVLPEKYISEIDQILL